MLLWNQCGKNIPYAVGKHEIYQIYMYSLMRNVCKADKDLDVVDDVHNLYITVARLNFSSARNGSKIGKLSVRIV